MSTTKHPITPPPELVRQWEINATLNRRAASLWTTAFAAEAAQWGADKELEACCEWLKKNTDYHITIEFLRFARRPKPPSRKEQALEAVSRLCASVIHDDLKDDAAIVRRALEALDD